MSWLPLFLFLSSVLIGSSWADQGVDTANEINVTPEEGASEGRVCATCGGKVAGYSVDSHGIHSTSSSSGGYGTYDTHDNLDLSSIMGMSSLGLTSLLSKGSGLSFGMFTLPILGVNIAILVLLGILLMHVKKLTSYGDAGTGDVYHYAAAPAYPAAGHSTYTQGYDSGYHRRSTEEGRGMDSPSTFQLVSQMVLDAIEKYSDVEVEAEQ